MTESTKTPTEILKEEHQAVLEKLDALEDIVNNLQYPEKVSSRLKELMSFFDTDFWMHFDKEEKALFPEFYNFMPRGVGPLAAMIDEHEVIRDTNTVMQDAAKRYLNKADDADARHTIAESGMHFIEYLRSHIFKEDSILFRMAEMHLDRTKNERVVRLFDEMEKTVESGKRD